MGYDAAIRVEEPYGIAHHAPPDPGVWLLSPIPMAILCFGLAALVARLGRRRFEAVGAAVGFAGGIAIIALLQDDSERLVDNARNHWAWIVWVTLLGIAGGFAARISEPVTLSPDRLRIGAWIALRMVTATLLGSAVMIAPGVLFVAALRNSVGTALGWLAFLLFLCGITFGGWIVGRLAPRFPVPCAILSVLVPPLLAITILGDDTDLDAIVGTMAVLSVPAAVTAYIASTRSIRARARREREAQGYGTELVRVTAFALFGAALLAGMWSMSRDNCGMQHELLNQRIDDVGNIRSPAEALEYLEDSGLEARHVAGGPDGYRLEVDEPQGVCNMLSRRTLIATYPPP